VEETKEETAVAGGKCLESDENRDLGKKPESMDDQGKVEPELDFPEL